LIGVSLPGGSIASYKYDAFGRRIAKTVDGQTTEFLWQGERLIAESADNRYRSYIYEPGSFRPLVMLDGEGPLKAAPFYYQLDHLGTPQELTDYSGEIMWSAKYRAYGNLATLDVAEIDNPLRFQGQYFDAETGLHYNRHRYYNPGTGRFLTPDPIKLAGGLNNYQYVPNPTGWVDPLGLNTCPGGDACKPDTGVENPATKAKVDAREPSPPAPSTPKLSKNAERLRTGGKNTTVNVKTKREADQLLNEAFPGYQKVRGVGSQDAVGERKKFKLERFKKGRAYHKDYAIDPKTGRVRGHGLEDAHGEHPHINVKRDDGTKVVINITGE
jgi:RHS repeat-associated protein